MDRTPSPLPRLLIAIVVGVAIVASTALFTRGIIQAFHIKHAEQRITVTGSAVRRIKSDLVVWKAVLKSQATEMPQAYKKLAADVPAAIAFIKSRGIDEKMVKVSAASIEELHPRDREGHMLPEQISGYVTTQTIEVESKDIDAIEKLSREATELIDRGVYIHSEPPLYIYTKLAELKVQMLADASRDARQRAEQIAQNTGSHVTSLITARMGVMQINPAYSTEVSGEGNNDKSSLEKDVLAIVSTSFGVD